MPGAQVTDQRAQAAQSGWTGWTLSHRVSPVHRQSRQNPSNPIRHERWRGVWRARWLLTRYREVACAGLLRLRWCRHSSSSSTAIAPAAARALARRTRPTSPFRRARSHGRAVRTPSRSSSFLRPSASASGSVANAAPQCLGHCPAPVSLWFRRDRWMVLCRRNPPRTSTGVPEPTGAALPPICPFSTARHRPQARPARRGLAALDGRGTGRESHNPCPHADPY